MLADIHVITSIFQQSYLNLYLLAGQRAMLIDSGFAYTPKDTIIPFLERIGFPVSHITWLTITHASADHCGGSQALKQTVPDLKIVAHTRENAALSDAEQFLSEHINLFEEFGLSIPYPSPGSMAFKQLHGEMVPADLKVNGGEIFSLDREWEVKLLHGPGHTPGHLMVFDTKNEALFAGDALLGEGIPNSDGKLTMPPHYFEVDWYLQTIEQALRLQPKYLFLTHFPPIIGEDAIAFIRKSKKFVVNCSALVEGILASGNQPMRLEQVINLLRSEIGIPGSEYQYALLARAHLRKLVSQGRALQSDSNSFTFHLAT